MEVQPAASVQFDPPDVSSEQKSKISCKTWQSFLCRFCFSWCKNAFWNALVSWFQTFQSFAQEDYYFFFASTAGRKSSGVTAGALGDTLPKKQSGKARVGGLSPNFIYVRFINKHMALLLGVPGAVWGHSLFCRFSPAVSRSPVCPLPPPCPPAAPGAICRVPSVVEDGVTTGWPGGSLRQPQSPSSVLSRRRKSFSKRRLHLEFL